MHNDDRNAKNADAGSGAADCEENTNANAHLLHEARRETTDKFMQFIAERVLAPVKTGASPTARTIAIRLVVLMELTNPSGRTLRSYAEQLGCSTAALTRAAYRFAGSLGMHASWQRIYSRAACSAAALGRHAASAKSSQIERRARRLSARKI